jgi:glycolate oxidase FAD binding subunit
MALIGRILNGTSAGVSAAAHLPDAVAGTSAVETIAARGTAVTLLRIEGFGPAVAAHLSCVRRAVNDKGCCEVLDGSEADAMWAEVRDATFFGGTQLPVWRVSAPPCRGADIGFRLAEDMGARHFYDLAGAAVWAETPDARAAELRNLLRSIVGMDGHATLVRAPAAVRAAVAPLHPLEPAVAALTRRLQRQFDPQQILNPGRMYEVL